MVIAVSSDRRVRERKGSKRPILSQKDRLALVDAVKYVDYSLIAPEPNKKYPFPTMKILATLKPDVFVSVDKKWLPFRSEIERLGVKLEVIPRGNMNSTDLF